jgi:hypothetical protein
MIQPFSPMDQEQESGSTGGQARSGGGLGTEPPTTKGDQPKIGHEWLLLELERHYPNVSVWKLTGSEHCSLCSIMLRSTAKLMMLGIALLSGSMINYEPADHPGARASD